MLADFGLIERDAGGDTPYYDETALVHSPQERLLRDGRWEDSLLPMQGLPEADRRSTAASWPRCRPCIRGAATTDARSSPSC